MQSDYEVTFEVKHKEDLIFKVSSSYYKLSKKDKIKAIWELHMFCDTESKRMSDED